jgi:pilus assembly protein Flp/PilA
MLLGMYTKVQTMWLGLRDRFTNEEGAVATEYALLIVLIALAIVAAVTLLGTAISGKFGEAKDSLNGA